MSTPRPNALSSESSSDKNNGDSLIYTPLFLFCFLDVNNTSHHQDLSRKERELDAKEAELRQREKVIR